MRSVVDRKVVMRGIPVLYGIYTSLCVHHYFSCLVQLLPGTNWHDFEVKLKIRVRGWLVTWVGFLRRCLSRR